MYSRELRYIYWPSVAVAVESGVSVVWRRSGLVLSGGGKVRAGQLNYQGRELFLLLKRKRH